MGYNTSNPPIVENTTQSNTENLQTQNLQLNKLLEDRNKKLPMIAPNIADIHRRTDRVEKNMIAKQNEFYNKRGKFIPKGTLYHIHYTKDLEIYHMTGGEHNESTELIFRKNVYENDFQYYNKLNKQKLSVLKPTSKPPTDENYNSGKMTRYFAKKTNQSSSPVFEIAEKDSGSSSLYDYVSLTWYIRGNKRKTEKLNKREIFIASQVIPSIGKLLPTLQYYRSDETVSPKQSVMDRLGLTGEQRDSQQETTTTSSPKTNTQQSVPSGVPSDVYFVGAGGGTGGSY